jgi:hypothetical protein
MLCLHLGELAGREAQMRYHEIYMKLTPQDQWRRVLKQNPGAGVPETPAMTVSQ